MNTKHTPGPWIVRCHDMVYAQTNTGERLVADCEAIDKSKRPAPPTETDMANARLIAAAPDLLAALAAAVEFEDKLLADENMGRSEEYKLPESPWVPYARAAIAKAKGG